MNTSFQFCDDLGPEKVVEIYEPETGLRAIVVVDNTAAGPAIGGVRMAADVTATECFRLARAMTLKNAMAGLAHGGGKSVIVGDPGAAIETRETLVRAFARAIEPLVDYIPGPDMGTNETAMAWVRDVTGRSVGLPREVGGIPLDEIGATGYGLAAALEVAESFSDFRVDGARVVVQGFGSVGIHAARFLVERGGTLVGVSDSRGARAAPDGFDLAGLIETKRSGAGVAEHGEGDAIAAADLVDVECDVWIPAARPDVLTADNVERLRTRVIAQGANIPATAEAEKIMADRGVLVLPDFVANAGGVICAAVEYHGGTERLAMETIWEKIQGNVRAVLERAGERGELPREAALAIATERVRRAMSFRRST